jgi:GWxTD domain-containing protein
MKKTMWLTVVLLMCQWLPGIKEKELFKKLPARYQTWLSEDVVYIIAEKEREVFLQLATDLEREAFIKAFWKQRDPNPSTPENEFQVEHYRRIAYANNWFGKDSPGPGWKTDQGRIYIQLGEPSSIDRIENKTELRNMIIWYYQGKMEYGLPNAFNVMFFKRDFTGEYELYSPVRFGPQYLMVDYDGDMSDYETAYFTLMGIEPSVAELSLSLIPGESSGYSPSMSSEMLINNKIPTAPIKKVNISYAEKMLRYKDMVEIDYTANFIESAKLVTVVRHPAAGCYFVHYLIEPKKLTFEQYSDKFYTTLEIFGNVIDAQNRFVFQINKTIPVELTAEQMNKVKDKLFSFQDMFPLIPGKYRLTVLMKNTVSREFTSIESQVEVPDAAPTGLTPLLLANKMVENSSFRGQGKPFLIGGRQLLPSPRNDFIKGDTLFLFFQLPGIGGELRGQGRLRFEIVKDNAPVQAFEKKIAEYPEFPDIIETISLEGLPAANYVARVTLLSPQGGSLGVEESAFYITPMQVLPRPWTLSVPLPSITAPQYWNDRGNQYFNLKNVREARTFFERAYHLAPQTPAFAMDYCRALLELKDYQQAKEIAMLPYKNLKRNEFLMILAQASQALKQHAEAIDYYTQHISHFGGSPKILNAMGECYLALGQAQEAVVTWEKSLKIDPKQEKLKEMIAAAKGGSK